MSLTIKMSNDHTIKMEKKKFKLKYLVYILSIRGRGYLLLNSFL